MTETHDFEIFCPNNHPQTVSFTREGFEDTLKDDGLVFHCNTCDTNWTLSHEQIEKIRKTLGEKRS